MEDKCNSSRYNLNEHNHGVQDLDIDIDKAGIPDGIVFGSCCSLTLGYNLSEHKYDKCDDTGGYTDKTAAD